MVQNCHLWAVARLNQITASFYRSPDVVQLARSLIGCTLHTNIEGHHTAGIIVETEAYKAPEDKACHAYGNKRTARTETMFREGGIGYIYLCYGIHHLFNVVTGPEDHAHAVLIRAVKPIEGVDLMMERRLKPNLDYRLTSGPGSMSKALGIHKDLNGCSLFEPDSPIWIENRLEEPEEIISSSRVGVDYAQECAAWPWRFRWAGSPWCSPAK